MASLSVDWPRPEVVVDCFAHHLWDPGTDTIVGFEGPLSRGRVVYALQFYGNGGISLRYSPKPVNESSSFGLDLSAVIPAGVGISSGALSIFSNVVAPAASDSDWTVGGIEVHGRSLFARLTGGIEGKDYQLRWRVTDTDGNVWERTALVLCSPTS